MNSTNIKASIIESVSSFECFNKLSEINNSYLIDVRTKPEWEFIGVPDLCSLNKKTIFISWRMYPKMEINSFFNNQIIESNIKKDDKLFIICRSGERSLHAARHLTSCGYSHCYNVSDGFEGKKNNQNRRSAINGWKYNNLPRQQ